MISQLQPGMTRDQVRYVMGSPLIADTFHQSRWDYHYQVRRGNDELEKQSLTLFFDGDLLATIQSNQGAVSPKKLSEPTPSDENNEAVLPADIET